MKNKNANTQTKAFTLVELLVVIAIIALLMAILVQGLQKAMDLAYRIKCGSNLKNIATASYTYATTQGEYYVPFSYVGGNQAKLLGNYSYNSGDRIWYQDRTFRKYLNVEDYIVSSNLKAMPKEFLCPADKISKKKTDIEDRISYAYNNTDWRPWTIAYTIVGYKVTTVKNPAETLNFIDAVDFWVDINGAHYVYVWDRIKDTTNMSQWPADISGDAAMYRHNEGANIGFYDGHAQWMKKQDIFYRDGYNMTPARMGMWTATGRIISGWFKRWPD
jgi:prepilin-type N-terminal cleavage/methylation domain-containing protein/prepilin-type processing-associated H-X9-DG protein